MNISIISENFVKFLGYSRISNRSYNVVERTWCDGKSHVRAHVRLDNVPRRPEDLRGKNICQLQEDGTCGAWEITHTSCDCHDGVDPLFVAEVGAMPKGFAPNSVLEALGLCRKLEAGEILLRQIRAYTSDWSHSWDIEEVYEGGVVTEADLQHHHLLRPGEEVFLEESCYNGSLSGYRTHKVRFVDQNGQLLRLDGEVAEKRAFSQEQFKWLLENGFTDVQASRIMRAAGPGQVRGALEWARTAKTVAEQMLRKNPYAFGWQGSLIKKMGEVARIWARHRKNSAIKEAGLPPIEARSANCLTMTVRGVLEILKIWESQTS